MLNFIENFLYKNRLKGCVYNENKISYFLNPTGWAKPLENGFVPPLDGSDGDVGVNVPQFYMYVKDTGTKYQLWISDFNIDGTFIRVHPFIISHTKTMTRTREDGKEEVFSACIHRTNTTYLGGDKSSSVDAGKLQGRPRTGITYTQANEFCANKKTDYNLIRGSNGQNTDKSIRVLLVDGGLLAVLRLALVSSLLIGFGRILMLMPASLLRLNLIK